MIPLIGLLLCIYLVFKGFEIFQIAWCAKDPPIMGIIIGICAIVSAIVIALFFGYLFIAPSVPTSGYPELPKI